MFLRVKTYPFAYGGGGHWYGELVPTHSPEGHDFHELTRVLSAKDVEELNKAEIHVGSDYWYRPGQTTNRFFSEEHLTALAVAEYKKVYPDAVLLMLGSRSTADPQLVLDGPEDVKEKINAWYQQAEDVGWYKRKGDNTAMRKISDEYWEYFNADQAS